MHYGWAVDCRWYYHGRYFYDTKDEDLQDSQQVNSILVYINALWVIDCRWGYLDHYFSISITTFFAQKMKFYNILDA